jgi:hypothetical protein
MQNAIFRVLLVLLLAVMFAGCELIGDIFQAGVAVGIIIVIVVIVLLVMLFRR